MAIQGAFFNNAGTGSNSVTTQNTGQHIIFSFSSGSLNQGRFATDAFFTKQTGSLSANDSNGE